MNWNEIVNKKIMSLSDARSLVSDWKAMDKSVVFTNGCFDLLHEGHLAILKFAKSQGDKLIVGLNSDHSVKKLKGDDRPIQNQQLRSELLASLMFVDLVIIFEDETPLLLIESLLPQVLVKGGDYSIDNVVGANLVLEDGGRVEIFELLDGHSTTQTVNKLIKRK